MDLRVNRVQLTTANTQFNICLGRVLHIYIYIYRIITDSVKQCQPLQ